jgi:asparaginyl-tRNA synthetase
MSEVVRIADVLAGLMPTGTRVTVQGWVRTRRDSKAGLSFVHLHDGSCFDALQVVAATSLDNYEADVLRLTAGCAVTVSGSIAPSQGQGQSVELQAESIAVVGWVDDPESYPISPKRHTFEYLREVAHLRPRTNTIGAVARVRHTLAMAIHGYFHEHGFHWIHTPIVTASDAEGAGELFRVSTLDLANLPRTPEGGVDFTQDFFGKPAFLTVSGQLNVETFCLAMTRVYTFGPTFRAENSNTSRHLSEFWMVEPEIAFADLADNADLAESLLKNVFQVLLDERPDDMAFFAERIDKEAIARLEALVASEFVRMSYSEAIDALERSGRAFEFPVEWGLALQAEHERYLCEEYARRPVVVVDYPKQIKAFYMRVNDDGRTVAAMDVLDARIAEMGLDPAPYWWYRDLRRYGTVPHAGFGLGFDRLVAYATGMANIRDVIPFPRTPGSADF